MNYAFIFALVILTSAGILFIVNYYLLKNSFLSRMGTVLVGICMLIAMLTFTVADYGVVHLFWTIPVGIAAVAGAILYLMMEVRGPFMDILTYLETIAQGKLDVSVNERKMHRKDEVGRVYHAFKSHVDRMQEIASFASEIGEGNLRARMEPSSDEDVLGLALVKMKSNLQDAVGEVDQMIRFAGEQGKFDTRMDTRGKEGVWRQLGQSLNDLLEGVAKPLGKINDIIGLMAKGDLTVRYHETDAKGDIRRMTENLNAALDHIGQLLSQVAENTIVIDEFTDEMRVSSQEMSINTTEIASSIAEMSSGAQSQVVKVDEASTLMEGILGSSRQMGDKAKDIHDAARIGMENSEKGMSMVTDVVDSMLQISQYTEKTNSSIHALTGRSNEIARVLGVITEIAAQTNLLALNAAIEAAQAGDAGRGFAIVAEEIRKLAEDSKNSVQEIEKVVQDVKKDTTQAVDVMEQMKHSVQTGESTSKTASDAFKEIFESSTKTLQQSREIVEAAEAQINSINEVVSITESIVVVAEETAAGTEEVASSANELSGGMEAYNQQIHTLASIADTLKQGVASLRLGSAGLKEEEVVAEGAE